MPAGGQPTTPISRETAPFSISVLNPQMPAGGQPTTPISRETAPFSISVLNPQMPTGAQPASPITRNAIGPSVSISTLAPAGTLSLSARARISEKRASGMLTRPLEGVDSDGDGLPDWLELEIGTNPRNPDTDGDGFPDGLEIVLGSDPLDRESVPSLIIRRESVMPQVGILCVTCKPLDFKQQ
jgi:hypothetical protein